MYSLTVSLCYELQQAHEKKDKTWNEQADRFFNYMMDNFETELSSTTASPQARKKLSGTLIYSWPPELSVPILVPCQTT